MPIESGMLTAARGAQKKVETYYYDIRAGVRVRRGMNNQRRAVYSERRRVLDGRPEEAGDRLWRAHHGRDC